VGKHEDKTSLGGIKTGLNGTIILRLLFKESNEIVNWIYLIHNGIVWHVVVNGVMNIWVPKIA
jgi:hypothetical protein